jgi:hypothetical protein
MSDMIGKLVKESNHIAMDKLYYRTVGSLGAFAVQNLRLTEFPAYCDDFVFSIHTQLVAEVLRDEDRTVYTIESSIPVSWWQRLKQDHFSKWMLKLFPVKYKTKRHELNIRVLATYPQFNKVCADLGDTKIKIKVDSDEVEAGTCKIEVTT